MKKYILLILLFIVVSIIAALSKLLHWPQADLMLSVGFVIQISTIFLLIFLLIKRNKKEAVIK